MRNNTALIYGFVKSVTTLTLFKTISSPGTGLYVFTGTSV